MAGEGVAATDASGWAMLVPIYRCHQFCSAAAIIAVQILGGFESSNYKIEPPLPSM